MAKELLFGLLIIISLTILNQSCTPREEDSVAVENKKDTLVALENSNARLQITLFGGAIVGFNVGKNEVNPFSWKLTEAQMPENNRNGAIFQGHFLCLGRWGGPSDGEKKLGMPHNGEPSNNWWNLVSVKDGKEAVMSCDAPLDGYTVKRTVVFSQNAGCFKVSETFTNDLSIGRIFTAVQHATLGSPFLDANLVVSSNATYGFNQDLAKYGLEKFEAEFPKTYSDTAKNVLDVSISSSPKGFVSTFIFADSVAWVTAANPGQKLLVGYVWKTSDYPWLHIWHGLKDGKPWARGLEFGTIGLGDNFSFADRYTAAFHGVKNIEFLDAKTSCTKSYYCFGFQLPEGFQKALSVTVIKGVIVARCLTNTGIKEIQLAL